MRLGAAIGLLCVIATQSWSQEVEQGKGAVLRALDKVNASVQDLELKNGEETVFERLRVDLRECRYPKDDPAGDAYAYLTIRNATDGESYFSGWMLASSPALNALEHPRYDVWVLRCMTELGSTSSGTD